MIGLRVFQRGDKWEVSACNYQGTPRIEDFYVAQSEEEALAYIKRIEEVTTQFRRDWQS